MEAEGVKGRKRARARIDIQKSEIEPKDGNRGCCV